MSRDPRRLVRQEQGVEREKRDNIEKRSVPVYTSLCIIYNAIRRGILNYTFRLLIFFIVSVRGTRTFSIYDAQIFSNVKERRVLNAV